MNGSLTTTLTNGLLSQDPNAANDTATDGYSTEIIKNGMLVQSGLNPAASAEQFYLPTPNAGTASDGNGNELGSPALGGTIYGDDGDGTYDVANLISNDGTFKYVPTPGTTGQDSFVAYIISDTAAASASGSSAASSDVSGSSITPDFKKPRKTTPIPTTPSQLVSPEYVITVDINIVPTNGVPIVPTAGALSGTTPMALPSYNLTTLGTSDWTHWGTGANAAAFDDKSIGGSQISNVSKVGSGGFGDYSNSTRSVSWTDGTPLSSDSGDDSYIWANNGIGAGYSFTAPADTTSRTLNVYLGGYSSGGTLTATLSDGSAKPYTVSFSGAATYSDVAQITYYAASPNQTLTVSYTKSQNINGTGGSVDLIAAWLVGPTTGVNPTITQNPTNQPFVQDGTATFTADASGTPAPTDVQWFVSPGPGEAATAIIGATSKTLTINDDDYDVGYLFDAEFSAPNTNNSETAGSSAMTSAASLGIPPVVTANPSSKAATVGQDVTFTAAASGSPTPDVQWMVEAPGATSFSAILSNASASTTTLDLGAVDLTKNGNEYEAVFSNDVGSPSSSISFTAVATTVATLTVSSGATGGAISGTSTAAAAPYSLTTLGTTDWAHWGLGGSDSAFDDEGTGGSQISNITRVGSGGYGGYQDSSRTVSWINGMPVTSSSADHGYIWANNAIGAGYSFTVPADTTTRTVDVYLGGYDSTGTLTATLSDSSASPYTISFSGSAIYSDVVAITYSAGSANQKLTLTYTKASGGVIGGSVDLDAAWLVAPSAPNVILNPKTQSITAGSTVTFTASASGNPTPTVQWQVSTDGGNTFTNIPGATSTTYSFTANTGENGYEYQAVFTNSLNYSITSPATLTVTAAPSGSIAGVSSPAGLTYNLTTQGTRDWAHWGRDGNGSGFDHKATGGSQISNVTSVGSGAGYGGYTNTGRGVSWTDGTPLAKDGGDGGYIWANNALGAGYSFTVPADTTKRTIYVYLGGYSSGGTLTAQLSDSSANPYSVNLSGTSVYSNIVAITYSAGSASQTLKLTYTKTTTIGSAGGSVDLIAAWLQ